MNKESKQVIVMRKDLNMRKGKMVAQGAHASLKAVIDSGYIDNISEHISLLNIYNDCKEKKANDSCYNYIDINTFETVKKNVKEYSNFYKKINYRIIKSELPIKEPYSNTKDNIYYVLALSNFLSDLRYTLVTVARNVSLTIYIFVFISSIST
jgi:peptidyl-tRNA hydrolase